MSDAGVFLVARNPEADSSLPYLLYLPLNSGGIWLKAKESWPRANRVYCHLVLREPPDDVEILQRVPVTVCQRRGPAIDLILARGLHKRSQFIFTQSRGRELIFWQTPKSAKAAKPGLRIPTGHARYGVKLYVDTRERYGYSFKTHNAKVERLALTVGDYAALAGGRIIAAVERKSIDDFATSLSDGSLNFAMAELAALPAAAISVEGTYSNLLRHAYTRAGFIPDLIARLQIRYPNVAIAFLESRKIAEEWTYRYLLAAYANDGVMPLPLELKN